MPDYVVYPLLELARTKADNCRVAQGNSSVTDESQGRHHRPQPERESRSVLHERLPRRKLNLRVWCTISLCFQADFVGVYCFIKKRPFLPLLGVSCTVCNHQTALCAIFAVWWLHTVHETPSNGKNGLVLSVTYTPCVHASSALLGNGLSKCLLLKRESFFFLLYSSCFLGRLLTPCFSVRFHKKAIKLYCGL